MSEADWTNEVASLAHQVEEMRQEVVGAMAKLELLAVRDRTLRYALRAVAEMVEVYGDDMPILVVDRINEIMKDIGEEPGHED